MSGITRAWPNLGAYHFFSSTSAISKLYVLLVLDWARVRSLVFAWRHEKHFFAPERPNLRLGFDFSLGIPVI